MQTEALLLLGAANAVGSSDPCQENLSITAASRVRRQVSALRVGGIVLIGQGPPEIGTLLPIQLYTYRLLQARFTLRLIGTERPGLRAFRMTGTTNRSLATVVAPAPTPGYGGCA